MKDSSVVGRSRVGLPVRLVQAVLWLIIAFAFAHLYVDVTSTSVPVHGWFAGAALLALAIGSATGVVDIRPVMLVSGIASVATVVLALGLLRAHVAHETGLLLVVSASLGAVIALVRLRSAPESPGRQPGDSSSVSS